MLVWLIWSICVCALSALACAMQKHQRDCFTQALTTKQNAQLILIGWSILTMSFCFAWFEQGFSIGISLWCCALSLSALTVALTLTYAPKKIIVMNIIMLFIFIAQFLTYFAIL